MGIDKTYCDFYTDATCQWMHIEFHIHEHMRNATRQRNRPKIDMGALIWMLMDEC